VPVVARTEAVNLATLTLFAWPYVRPSWFAVRRSLLHTVSGATRRRSRAPAMNVGISIIALRPDRLM
jgi:hypothetical protein